MSDDTLRPTEEPFGETEPDFENTENLPNHVEEDLAIEDDNEPDPEDEFLEPEDTKYTEVED